MILSDMVATATITTPARWLSIVGIGEDGAAGLSPIARRLIENAELVVGGARHLALAGALVRGERLTWPSPMDAAFTEVVARRGRAVTVVASGDPFHYGVGKQLAALVDAEEILCVPHA
jgi:precorrin-6Y C5,15-methyltransferase (decarboxylating)